MSFSFMAFALALLAQESAFVATTEASAAPATAATEAPAEPRIICKNIEVTGSRLAKKKKVCLPEGDMVSVGSSQHEVRFQARRKLSLFLQNA